MRIYLSLLLIISFSNINYAQHAFIRNDTVKVSNDLGLLKHAWAGGANFVQISEIDLNFDNKKDLFLFDRSGNRIMCFLNTGTQGQTSYTFAPYLTYSFPKLEHWALLRDYNGDGKEDIFTSSNGGIKVYQNISTQSNGVQFMLVEPSIISNYQPNILTLFITPTDIPALDDIDGDGDIDILTFSNTGSCLEYHQNQSMELYGNADSLAYKRVTDNWGLFYENIQDNNVTLNDSCDNPEHITIHENIYLLKDNEPGGQEERHIGSTVTSFDIEGDGDKDLFLGDVSFTNLLHLTNGGNSQFAQATAIDLYFPSYDNSVNIQFFPGAYFIDINNDNKPEMLIGSNAMLNGENFTGIHQYNNTGTLPNSTFDYIRRDFLQGDMIDVGDYALPTFFDYNNDGLLDIVIGNNGYYQYDGSYKSMLALFKNTGTANAPTYKLLTRDWCGLSTIGLNYMSPTFGDLDGDGKMDLVTGDRTGGLHFYKNISPSADTSYFSYVPTSFQDIDVGGFSMPCLFDLDKDGKLDLVVGEKNGTVSFFRNNGTQVNYIFSDMPEIDPLGQFEVADENVTSFGYSAPFLLDSAGTTQMIVGSERGQLFYFNNIDGNLNGNFYLIDSVFTGFRKFGTFAAPAAADINNDGYLDVIIGNIAGGISLYMGTFPTGLSEPLNFNNINIYPNPALSSVNITIPENISKASIELIDNTGRIVKQIVASAQKTITINIEDLTSGIYSVVFQSPYSIATKKLVVINN